MLRAVGFSSLSDICSRLNVMAAVLLVFASPVAAADITLALKGGGGFQISGELRAFDGKRYTIINPSFGKMEVDATRFNCISDGCPSRPIKPQVSLAGLFTPGRTSQVALAGSNTIGAQLMPEVIQAYAAKLKLQSTVVSSSNPLNMAFRLSDLSGREVARISLRRQGSSASFRSLRQRQVDIGLSSRPIKDTEAVALNAAGLGDMRSATNEHVIALDGLLIVTSVNNPAISMSLDEVAKVFSGQVTDWSQVGYPPGAINVYAPTSDSGTWETFNTLVLQPRNLRLVNSAKRTTNHSEQSDWVAADPLAIGVVGFSYQRSAKPLNIEAGCGLITPPSNFAVKTEEYPLSRRLFLYTPGRPTQPLAANLLDFALSEEAQPAIRKADFIDQSADLISFTDQGSRVAYALNAPQQDFDLDLMRTFLQDLKGHSRLTYTFRFRSGSFALDSKSKQDVAKLSNLLLAGKLKGRAIKLIGFADAGGSFQTNLALSISRAQAVRAELLEASDNRLQSGGLEIKGYGELAPVACNDTLQGKAFNRRVEVWVAPTQ